MSTPVSGVGYFSNIEIPNNLIVEFSPSSWLTISVLVLIDGASYSPNIEVLNNLIIWFFPKS